LIGNGSAALELGIGTGRVALDASRQSAAVSHATCRMGRYARSASGSFAATCQMWPSGSVKLAVRIPHSRFIGPLSNSTPRVASSLHITSVSSTQIVSWKRDLSTADSCRLVHRRNKRHRLQARLQRKRMIKPNPRRLDCRPGIDTGSSRDQPPPTSSRRSR
jgi:hypothetical protein